MKKRGLAERFAVGKHKEILAKNYTPQGVRLLREIYAKAKLRVLILA